MVLIKGCQVVGIFIPTCVRKGNVQISRSASKAKVDEFAPKLRGIMASVMPAAVKIGAIRPEKSGTLRVTPDDRPIISGEPDRLLSVH